MASNIRNILDRLDRGELDSETAIKEMKRQKNENSGGMNHFLKVNVTRLHDEQPRVNVRIPLSFVGLGLAIGSKYAPELNDLDLDQIIEDLHDLTDGTILEVQDIEGNEHVLVSIESS